MCTAEPRTKLHPPVYTTQVAAHSYELPFLVGSPPLAADQALRATLSTRLAGAAGCDAPPSSCMLTRRKTNCIPHEPTPGALQAAAKPGAGHRPWPGGGAAWAGRRPGRHSQGGWGACQGSPALAASRRAEVCLGGHPHTWLPGRHPRPEVSPGAHTSFGLPCSGADCSPVADLSVTAAGRCCLATCWRPAGAGWAAFRCLSPRWPTPATLPSRRRQRRSS
jgi:hypothetical protein